MRKGLHLAAVSVPGWRRNNREGNMEAGALAPGLHPISRAGTRVSWPPSQPLSPGLASRWGCVSPPLEPPWVEGVWLQPSVAGKARGGAGTRRPPAPCGVWPWQGQGERLRVPSPGWGRWHRMSRERKQPPEPSAEKLGAILVPAVTGSWRWRLPKGHLGSWCPRDRSVPAGSRIQPRPPLLEELPTARGMLAALRRALLYLQATETLRAAFFSFLLKKKKKG